MLVMVSGFFLSGELDLETSRPESRQELGNTSIRQDQEPGNWEKAPGRTAGLPGWPGAWDGVSGIIFPDPNTMFLFLGFPKDTNNGSSGESSILRHCSLFRVPRIRLRRAEEDTIQRSVPAPRELPEALSKPSLV